MVLWTWAKGLEDDFDGKNRRNLKDFIQRDEKSRVTIHLEANTPSDNTIADDITEEPYDDSDDDTPSDAFSTYYYIDTVSPKGKEPERRELARIPTCAIFHKITEGRGVPHSFIGLIRQWPALPEFLVSIQANSRTQS